VIEVTGITKEFGRFTAVNGLSFSVAKGEVLGFLGPNGAGKTTTMRILTGFIPATRGTAVVAGHDILSEPLQAKRKIGSRAVIPRCRVSTTSTVATAASPGARMPIDESREVPIRRPRQVTKASKGYGSAWAAQALVHEPEVLILDEPTAGLDPKQINETRALIRSLGGDHTVVLSTHILPEVVMTCDRVVIINKGSVVAQGTTQSLIDQFREREHVQVTVEGPEGSTRGRRTGLAADALREGDVLTYRLSVAPGRDVRGELASRLVRAGYGLLGLHQEGTTLEEVYLRVVSSEEPGEAP
jgi:ABC-2 type transport system ATP-binding protein